MKCSCQSYNRPDLGGDNPPVIMKGKFVKKIGITVDACLEPIIQKLWDEGIPTDNSCCGHNGKLGKPSIILKEKDAIKAKEIVGTDIEIMYWKLLRV